MAIGTVLTLELATMDGRPVTFDHEQGEELYGEVRDILSNYLGARLSSGVEATVLFEIDPDCIEHICDGFAEGKLQFWFPNRWGYGADVAEHWYELALAACRDEVEAMLASRGLRVISPRPDLAALVGSRGKNPVFLLVGDALVSIDADGELDWDASEEQPDGTAWSDADRARVDAVAQSRRCHCTVCVDLRKTS